MLARSLRTHRCALPILLALWLAPIAASAGTFPIADRGLHLDVYTWDGRPCVVTPEQPDSSACTASDRASVPTLSEHAEVLAFAVIHLAGWDMTVLATRLDTGASAFDGVDREDMIAVAKRALRAALPSGARLVTEGLDEQAQAQRSNDVPFVRLTPTIETTLPSGVRGNLATVEYIVVSAFGIYEVSFASDAAHAADVAKIADNAIASLVASPPPRANVFDLLFFRLGRLGAFGIFAAIVGSFVMWLRTRKRRVQRVRV